MEDLRKYLIGFIVGMLLGLWGGINIGMERPIWSNPFDRKAVQRKIKEKGGEVLEKGGKVLEESGRKLQGKEE